MVPDGPQCETLVGVYRCVLTSGHFGRECESWGLDAEGRERVVMLGCVPVEDSPWGTANVPGYRRSECPHGPHRGPEGPNEDLARCPGCWAPSWCLRPEGETFGEHLPDCSLPLRHESHCKPGGSGHPPSRKKRGYFSTEV